MQKEFKSYIKSEQSGRWLYQFRCNSLNTAKKKVTEGSLVIAHSHTKCEDLVYIYKDGSFWTSGKICLLDEEWKEAIHSFVGDHFEEFTRANEDGEEEEEEFILNHGNLFDFLLYCVDKGFITCSIRVKKYDGEKKAE